MPSTPTVRTAVVDAAGHRLRADAAASYLRMLAAGMPVGGVDVFSRTMAEQQRLYDLYRAGKGPVAARPSLSAPHIDGRAIDTHTTTAGRYDPSGAHRWLSAGGDGSRPPRAGENLRAHAYGWRRTVSSERWHWEYDRARDQHRAADLKARLARLGYRDLKTFQRAHGLKPDGVDGPLTWAVLLGKPSPAPAPKPLPVATLGRLGVLNCGAWGRTSLPASRVRALVGVLKTIDASIYTLTESPEWLRDQLRALMPGGAARWRVVVRGSQAILFDSRKWRLVTPVPVPAVTFGPTSYHGGMYAIFEQTTTKARITVGCYHLPPNSVASQSSQRTLLQRFAARIKTRPALLGGDGADSGTWLDWQDARLAAKTSPNREAPTYGRSIRDRGHSLGLTIRRYQVVPSRGATDHDGLLIQFTIPA